MRFCQAPATNHVSSTCLLIQHGIENILHMGLSNYNLSARMGLHDQYQRHGQDQRGPTIRPQLTTSPVIWNAEQFEPQPVNRPRKKTRTDGDKADFLRLQRLYNHYPKWNGKTDLSRNRNEKIRMTKIHPVTGEEAIKENPPRLHEQLETSTTYRVHATFRKNLLEGTIRYLA